MLNPWGYQYASEVYASLAHHARRFLVPRVLQAARSCRRRDNDILLLW